MNTTDFDDATAVVAVGPGRYEAHIDRRFWIEVGPNAGYLAAVITRAVVATVGGRRSPRSLTVHFLVPPVEGPASVEVVVERTGRQLAFVSARLTQGERTCALALMALSAGFEAPSFADVEMPVVSPPDDVPRLTSLGDDIPVAPIFHCYDRRWVAGKFPFTGGSSVAANGGWIRLQEPRVLDHALLVALNDAWLPPTWSRIEDRLALPTIDLTVHFRSPLPHPGMRDDDFVLCAFRSRVAADGFVEEDGEIWSPDGVLLAQSRQLTAMLPMLPTAQN